MSEVFAENLYSVIVSILLLASLGILVFQIIRSRQALQNAEQAARKREEDLHEQTENARNAAKVKGDFLSRMSHEIRTPLNAIIGSAHIAQHTQNRDQARDSMSKVEANSRHLLQIVNDILDFSKLESGKMELEKELFSLKEDIEFVASMFRSRAEEKNIKLIVDVVGVRHDGVITDSLRLNQVLINLLSNAIKFTDQGEIRLTVEELLHQKGESIYRFSVSDTGIGVDPAKAANLFTSFTQASADTSRLFGGTGLGLAISQNLVTLMGGEIELETELGRGSYFSFTIRVDAEEKAKKPKAAIPNAKDLDLRGKRIMIVDDIEINREIVLALLEDTGADLAVAEDGRQAVEQFVASPPDYYNLILMDLQMPIMDGYAATEHIRALDRPDAKQVKIAAVSANALKEDVDHATRSGMNGYLIKPIDTTILYNMIGEWL